MQVSNRVPHFALTSYVLMQRRLLPINKGVAGIGVKLSLHGAGWLSRLFLT